MQRIWALVSEGALDIFEVWASDIPSSCCPAEALTVSLDRTTDELFSVSSLVSSRLSSALSVGSGPEGFSCVVFGAFVVLDGTVGVFEICVDRLGQYTHCISVVARSTTEEQRKSPTNIAKVPMVVRGKAHSFDFLGEARTIPFCHGRLYARRPLTTRTVIWQNTPKTVLLQILVWPRTKYNPYAKGKSEEIKL